MQFAFVAKIIPADEAIKGPIMPIFEQHKTVCAYTNNQGIMKMLKKKQRQSLNYRS